MVLKRRRRRRCPPSHRSAEEDALWSARSRGLHQARAMAAVLEAVIRRGDLAALEPCGDPVHAPDQQLRTDPKDMLGLFFSNTSGK